MESYKLAKDREGRVVQMAEGIRRNTLVHGEKTIMCRFCLDRGAVLPLHSHPYEQTGYAISGRLVFTIAGERHEVVGGDSWCIRENIEHGAEVVEDTVLVEVFSPVRKDFL